jgi:hypothetical protein
MDYAGGEDDWSGDRYVAGWLFCEGGSPETASAIYARFSSIEWSSLTRNPALKEEALQAIARQYKKPCYETQQDVQQAWAKVAQGNIVWLDVNDLHEGKPLNEYKFLYVPPTDTLYVWQTDEDVSPHHYDIIGSGMIPVRVSDKVIDGEAFNQSGKLHVSTYGYSFNGDEAEEYEGRAKQLFYEALRQKTSAEVPNRDLGDWPRGTTWYTSWIYIPETKKLLIEDAPEINHAALLAKSDLDMLNLPEDVVFGLILRNYIVGDEYIIFPEYSDRARDADFEFSDEYTQEAVIAVQAWASMNTNWGMLKVAQDEMGGQVQTGDIGVGLMFHPLQHLFRAVQFGYPWIKERSPRGHIVRHLHEELSRKLRHRMRHRHKYSMKVDAVFKWSYSPGDLEVWPVDDQGMPDHLRQLGMGRQQTDSQGHIYLVGPKAYLYVHPDRPWGMQRDERDALKKEAIQEVSRWINENLLTDAEQLPRPKAGYEELGEIYDWPNVPTYDPDLWWKFVGDTERGIQKVWACEDYNDQPYHADVTYDLLEHFDYDSEEYDRAIETMSTGYINPETHREPEIVWYSNETPVQNQQLEEWVARGIHDAEAKVAAKEYQVGAYRPGGTYKFVAVPDIGFVKVWQDDEYGVDSAFYDPEDYRTQAHMQVVLNELETNPDFESWWDYEESMAWENKRETEGIIMGTFSISLDGTKAHISPYNSRSNQSALDQTDLRSLLQLPEADYDSSYELDDPYSVVL